MGTSTLKANTIKVALALAAIYIIWGTTYYGIKVAIETIPPLLMAGFRWLIPGLFLFGWTIARGNGMPTAASWRRAAILGFFLMAIGNGAVTFAEKRMPSGVAALIVATVPLWASLLEWTMEGKRPGPIVGAGLGLGLAGVAILSQEGGGWVGGVDLRYLALPFFGSLGWAYGSLLSRRGVKPQWPWQDLALQMLLGGLYFVLGGAAIGEFRGWNPLEVSTGSLWAVLYLSVVGSVVAMGCYLWLLRATSPAVATTYAFVNPAVAVAVGVWLADEVVTVLTLAATGLIVAAVALIIWSKARRQSVVDAAPEA